MRIRPAIDARGAGLITLSEQNEFTALPKKGGAKAARCLEEGAAPAAPFVGGDFPDGDYQRIRQILKEQQGFDLGGYKDLCIKRRIAARIRAFALPTPEPYIDVLLNDPQEQQHLLAALTVHVSQFFRNPGTYALLEKQVLPELLRKARNSRTRLRVWSVGCAAGEEPYSVALLCRQLVDGTDQLSIIATDLSSEVLQRARRAVFATSRLAEVPEQVLENYFVPQGREFRLIDPVREQVRFFQHDILSDQPFRRADLILCRNVLIYFSRGQQQRILQILAAALPPGGYLVLGRAETLVAACRGLFRCVDPAERVYQRLATEAPVLPAALPPLSRNELAADCRIEHARARNRLIT